MPTNSPGASHTQESTNPCAGAARQSPTEVSAGWSRQTVPAGRPASSRDFPIPLHPFGSVLRPKVGRGGRGEGRAGFSPLELSSPRRPLPTCHLHSQLTFPSLASPPTLAAPTAPGTQSFSCNLPWERVQRLHSHGRKWGEEGRGLARALGFEEREVAGACREPERGALGERTCVCLALVGGSGARTTPRPEGEEGQSLSG